MAAIDVIAKSVLSLVQLVYVNQVVDRKVTVIRSPDMELFCSLPKVYHPIFDSPTKSLYLQMRQGSKDE